MASSPSFNGINLVSPAPLSRQPERLLDQTVDGFTLQLTRRVDACAWTLTRVHVFVSNLGDLGALQLQPQTSPHLFSQYGSESNHHSLYSQIAGRQTTLDVDIAHHVIQNAKSFLILLRTGGEPATCAV